MSVRVGETTARCYEVYWADLLENERVKGTFNPADVHILAWFPWLNLRAGLYDKGSTTRVVIWTWILAPAALAVQLIHVVVAVITRGSIWRSLDTTIADVTNYASSAGRATPAGSPVESAADEIDCRFRKTLARARDDGCREIFVVAHSLGTVIAYHALTNFLEKRPSAAELAARSLVTRLFTLGSPLEKFRFIWPTLVVRRPIGKGDLDQEGLNPYAAGLRWDNFRNPLDLVSGRLWHGESWGEVKDHRLFGRAGLGRAHVVYERDPAFVGAVGEALFGCLPPARPSWLTRLRLGMVALAETGLVTALPALGVVLGAALALIFALVMSVSSAIRVAGQAGATGDAYFDIFESVFKWTLAASLVGLYILGPVLYGRYHAGFVHQAFRFRKWPVDVSVGDPGDPDAEAVAGDSWDGPASAWFWSQDRWWVPAQPRQALRRIAVSIAFVAALPLGVFLSVGFGGQSPFAAGLGAGERFLWSVLAYVEGWLGLLVGLFLLVVVVLLIDLVAIVAKAYKAWRQSTTRNPNDT